MRPRRAQAPRSERATVIAVGPIAPVRTTSPDGAPRSSAPQQDPHRQALDYVAYVADITAPYGLRPTVLIALLPAGESGVVASNDIAPRQGVDS